MILKVKRLALIAAIEAKAKANQQLHDDKVAEYANDGNLEKAIDESIDKEFGKDVPDTTASVRSGYRKADAKASKTTLLTYLGLSAKRQVALPNLYAKELAALSLAQDDVLEIDDAHPYFGIAS